MSNPIDDSAPDELGDFLRNSRQQMEQEVAELFDPLPVLAPGDTIGNYQIKHLIGLGGMGEVYLVGHTLTRQEHALKLCSASSRDRFKREVEIHASLGRHRNIVEVTDAGVVEDQDLSYLVMDYIRGESLRFHIEYRRENKCLFSVDESQRLIEQVANALAHAHASKVVHADLKPSNILVDVAGNAFITDWGLSGSLSDAPVFSLEPGAGTPGYQAPEVSGGGPPDTQSDLYSLGILWFEMLTGYLPLSGAATVKQLEQSRPGVSKDILAVIAHLIEKVPADRTKSAEKLKHDLPTRPPTFRRKPVLAACMAVFLLGVLLGPFLYSISWFRPPEQRKDVSHMLSETVEDGTEILPGEVFEKTWTIRNDGDEFWSQYALQYVGGNMPCDQTPVLVPDLRPGEVHTLRKQFSAPFVPGNFVSSWQVNTEAGSPIEFPLDVRIQVPDADDARFEADVTVPDGEKISRQTSFEKVWEIRNTGRSTWRKGCRLVRLRGDRLASVDFVAVDSPVPPNGVWRVSVPMVAPNRVGEFQSIWQMQSPVPKSFGGLVHVLIEVE